MTTLSRRRFIGLAVAAAGISAVTAACGGSAAPASTATSAAAAAAPSSAAPAASPPAAASSAPAASPVASSTSPSAAGSAAASTSAPASASSAASGVPNPANLASSQKLVAALSNLEANMDPHALIGSTPRKYDMFEMLTKPNAVTGDPEPMLATEWKQLNPTTIQFKLRPNLKFHNGDALTADDVKFSFDRATRTDTPLVAKALLSTLTGAQVVDPQTVNFTTAAPDALLVKRFFLLAIIPQKYYMGLGSDNPSRDKAFGAALIGSGPYQMVSFKQGDSLVVKAYAAHSWRKPILTDITFRQFGDATAQRSSFVSGDTQYINLLPISVLSQIQAAGGTLLKSALGGSWSAFMDTVDHDGKPKPPPMGDVRVRQAINYAVDKEKMIKDLFAGVPVIDNGTLLSPGTPLYDPAIQPYAFNLDKANQLLDDAGFKRNGTNPRFKVSMGFSFAFPGSNFRDMGDFIQGQLQQVGIQADWQPITDGGLAHDYFVNNRQRPDIFQLGLYNRAAMDPDVPYNYFRSDHPAKHFANPDFDTAYRASQQELDPAKRKALIFQQSQIMHDQAPNLYLTGDIFIDAAAPKLQGAIALPAEGNNQYNDTLYFVK